MIALDRERQQRDRRNVRRNDRENWPYRSGDNTEAARDREITDDAMFAALIVFGITAQLGLIYYGGMPLVAAALFYEHKTEKLDLAGINRAFFQSNAFVSAVFLVAVCLDRLV